MGLRDLAKRVVKKLTEEGNSPGRPPPHRAQQDPLWEAQAPKAEPKKVEPKAESPKGGKPAEEKPWYLQGQEDLDGWDETNPGEEPGKANLRD